MANWFKMFKKKSSQTPESKQDSESSSSDIESFETLSLENESFISFKTRSNANSTIDLSLKSLAISISKMTIKERKEKVLNLIKEKLLILPKMISDNLYYDFKKLISKEKGKNLEKMFLGYYECLIPGNSELSIPKVSLYTARINLHEEKTEELTKAEHLVLTKIKESPYIENTSLFIITGIGIINKNNNDTVWTGKKFNKFREWMRNDSIKHLIDGIPVKGFGTYKVLINNIGNTDVYKDIKLKELEESAKKEDGFKYKMTLAGFYMIGIKEEDSSDLNPEAENWYKEAIKWFEEAEKLGSIEAKLCLGFMYSIGFSIKHYDPEKAKKLFKEVIEKYEATTTDNKAKEETTTDEVTEENTADKADKEVTEETTAVKEAADEAIASKELAKIAMRNVAMLYHNSYVIKPFEWKNFIKISNQNDLTVKNLMKIKLKLAVKWYERSYELGDDQSAYNLGLLYESDNEIEEAENWFNNATQCGNLYAKAKLGRILANKENTDDNEKGIQMLQDAAEGGLAMGQTYLGKAYEKEEKYDEAIELYLKAAKQNRGYYSHVAQYHLMEFRGKGLIPDGEDIKNILKLYVKELEYYYNNKVETLKNIH